jgi:ferrous iron transport protein B
LRSLLVDGVVGGVGGVIVFLPNIVLLFLGLAFLEDTGYMARAAFLTDRLMHRFGLHGKSFIPMLSGFGCSVPGIHGHAHVGESPRSHRDHAGAAAHVVWSAPDHLDAAHSRVFPAGLARAHVVVHLRRGHCLALVLALLLRKTLLRGEDAPFVMELPPYRLPTLRSVVIKMTERAGFICARRARPSWAFRSCFGPRRRSPSQRTTTWTRRLHRARSP